MTPRLFLTSMSHGGSATLENAREIIEPIKQWIDGTIWVLHDTDPSDAAAQYLESVKGCGRIVHRSWPAGRHWHSMNDTLFTGLIEEDDYVIWVDPLERVPEVFARRVKSEIIPAMQRDNVSVLSAWGKPYLFRYEETLEYRNTPHWTLTGFTGRHAELSLVEPDENKVRVNVRPIKRAGQPLHWVRHYARYHITSPAGANTCALGLDHFPPGDRNAQFAEREARRLAFRREMKRRGYPLTLDGLKAMLSAPHDEWVKGELRGEKILSDFWHHAVCGRTDVKDSHNPVDALPIA